jgi:Transposase DDE domain
VGPRRVFDQLQLVLLDELGAAGRVDLERVSVDSFSLRAVKGGDLTGANPTDRGKAGSKLHLAGERGGLPIAVVLSAANANDSTMFEAVLDDISPLLLPTGGDAGGPARSIPTRPTTTASRVRRALALMSWEMRCSTGRSCLLVGHAAPRSARTAR